MKNLLMSYKQNTTLLNAFYTNSNTFALAN